MQVHNSFQSVFNANGGIGLLSNVGVRCMMDAFNNESPGDPEWTRKFHALLQEQAMGSDRSSEIMEMAEEGNAHFSGIVPEQLTPEQLQMLGNVRRAIEKAATLPGIKEPVVNPPDVAKAYNKPPTGTGIDENA